MMDSDPRFGTTKLHRDEYRPTTTSLAENLRNNLCNVFIEICVRNLLDECFLSFCFDFACVAEV